MMRCPNHTRVDGEQINPALRFPPLVREHGLLASGDGGDIGKESIVKTDGREQRLRNGPASAWTKRPILRPSQVLHVFIACQRLDPASHLCQS